MDGLSVGDLRESPNYVAIIRSFVLFRDNIQERSTAGKFRQYGVLIMSRSGILNNPPFAPSASFASSAPPAYEEEEPEDKGDPNRDSDPEDSDLDRRPSAP